MERRYPNKTFSLVVAVSVLLGACTNERQHPRAVPGAETPNVEAQPQQEVAPVAKEETVADEATRESVKANLLKEIDTLEFKEQELIDFNQSIASATVNGGLMILPAGALAFASGYGLYSGLPNGSSKLSAAYERNLTKRFERKALAELKAAAERHGVIVSTQFARSEAFSKEINGLINTLRTGEIEKIEAKLKEIEESIEAASKQRNTHAVAQLEAEAKIRRDTIQQLKRVGNRTLIREVTASIEAAEQRAITEYKEQHLAKLNEQVKKNAVKWRRISAGLASIPLIFLTFESFDFIALEFAEASKLGELAKEKAKEIQAQKESIYKMATSLGIDLNAGNSEFNEKVRQALLRIEAAMNPSVTPDTPPEDSDFGSEDHPIGGVL